MDFPTFELPGRLLLLLLVPVFIALYILAMRRRGRLGMRFTNTSMLAAVVRPQSQWRRHLAVALSMLSLVALTVAFAKPSAEAKVPRERATVVLVIDVSQSMAATDVDPNRLDAAKTAAQGFVDDVPQGYNIAVVAMSGNAGIRLQPNGDKAAVKQAISSLRLEDGTAVGESIALGLEALRNAPEDPAHPDEPAPGAIVMLSDGESTIGRPAVQGADEAKQHQIPVYTIAYGTPTGYVDLDGERHPVPVNKEELAEVAEISGGEAFAASNAKQLASVYGKIGSSVGYETKQTEVTAQYVGYSFAFGLLAALAAISLAVRWP